MYGLMQVKTALCDLTQSEMELWWISNEIQIKLCALKQDSHSSLSTVMHAPVHAPMLRTALQAGLVHESAEVGQVS